MVKATLSTIQNRQPPPRQPLLPPPPPNTMIPDSSPRRSRLLPFRPSVLLMAPSRVFSLGRYFSCRTLGDHSRRAETRKSRPSAVALVASASFG